MATIMETKTTLQTEATVIPYAPKYVLQTLPASLPVCQVDADLNIEAVASPVIERLASLATHDLSTEPIWRDTFALTGSLRTFYSAQSIIKAWTDTCTMRQAADFKILAGSGQLKSLGEKNSWVEVGFNFHLTGNPAAQCTGFVSLVNEGAKWKIWLLRTVLEQLNGCNDVDRLPARAQAVYKSEPTNDTASPNVTDNENELNGGAAVLDCVIVGGGQSGLSCGGRLEALGAQYIILEKNPRVGDSWATRYDSAKLHTIREYNHLPFNHTFTDRYNQFLTKDELAEGYRSWASEFGVDKHIWLETSLERGTWDPLKQLWTLQVSRSGAPETIISRTVVMAVGAGGQRPTMPVFPGQGNYAGTILHSVEYRSAAQWKGKAGIVIGTANTAHDVAGDMVEAGLSSITMVQRTRTHVLPCEYFSAMVKGSYNDDADIAISDRAGFSMPHAVSRLASKRMLDHMAGQEPKRFDALEHAGFRCARYGEMQWHILERLGGHYIDVGCSKMIAEGLIKMKSGPIITSFTPHGVAFSDGTEIPADVVIFCTGFVGSFRGDIEQIFGTSIADEVGEFWGLDEEGELRGAFKRTGHPGMWCMGGTIPQARYYSRHVALQIKALAMGCPVPVYTGERYTQHSSDQAS